MNPLLPSHSLDAAGVLKIALSREASITLAASGPFHFALITKADVTAPEAAQGCMILHCLPVSKDRANDAFRVATGQSFARKAKLPGTPGDPKQADLFGEPAKSPAETEASPEEMAQFFADLKHHLEEIPATGNLTKPHLQIGVETVASPGRGEGIPRK